MSAFCGPWWPAPVAVNRLLIDRDFEAGDEPVKLCVQDGVPVELRKQLAADLQIRHDRRVGRILPFRAGWSAAACGAGRGLRRRRRAHMPHEEAVRDLLKERSHRFEVADVTGFPWIEIDFPIDVVRATEEVLPQLQTLSRGSL